MVTFYKTIQTVVNNRFVSCLENPQQNEVRLVDAEDGSGRQRWKLQAVGPDTYNLTPMGGRTSTHNILSVPAGPAGRVDMFVRDEGSGRQRFTFLPVAGRPNVFTISVEAGLLDPTKKFVTVGPAGLAMLLAERRPSPPDANDRQLFKLADVPPLPKVYVGSAFPLCLSQMADNPEAWKEVAARVGFHLHPMCFFDGRDKGWLRRLLNQVAFKEWVYESDLLAWTDGSNPVQTNTPWCWRDYLREVAPEFKCVGHSSWVNCNILGPDPERAAVSREHALGHFGLHLRFSS
jgi:hypothetical protein